MKRRRRIEITRYSRRITVIQSETAAAETAAEQQTDDLILERFEDLLTPEQADRDGPVPDDVEADQPPRHRPFFSLRDLLRLRK